MELRILAHVAGEDVLKSIFERGEDVHAATAAEVLKLEPGEIGPGERSRAKAVNFGIVYGLSAHGLSEQLSIPHEEAAEYIERYMSRFPAVQTFIDDDRRGDRRGYVQTLFGRRRPIPELRSRTGDALPGERLAVNTIIQGTAADIIKVAMVPATTHCARPGWRPAWCSRSTTSCCSRARRRRWSGDGDRAAEMEAACELDPPLEVDIGVGENWWRRSRWTGHSSRGWRRSSSAG